MVKRNFIIPVILFLINHYSYCQADTVGVIYFDTANPRIGSIINLHWIPSLERWDYRDAATIYKEAANFINKYPSLIFQLESHTDCRASAEYNRDLSQRRADSAKANIRRLLKDTNQLPTAIGMGEDDLFIKKCSCDLSDYKNICTEWEHQQNRRTILRVIGFKKGYNDSLSTRVKAHAEGILNNSVTPHDDLLTSACIDSLTSENSDTRDYYFKVVAVIAGKSDGALSEAVGVYLKSYLDYYSAEFFKNYKSINDKQQDDLVEFIAFEFYIAADEDIAKYNGGVEEFFNNLLNNCTNCKKYKKTVKKVKAKLLEKY